MSFTVSALQLQYYFSQISYVYVHFHFGMKIGQIMILTTEITKFARRFTVATLWRTQLIPLKKFSICL